MTVHGKLGSDLDLIARHASAALLHGARSRAFSVALRTSIPLLGLVPLFHLGVQFARWNGGGAARLAPLVLVALVAIAMPFAVAWFSARDASRRGVARQRALGEADRQLLLAGRLQAADEFLTHDARTGFEEAAIEDAAARAESARDAALNPGLESITFDRRTGVWASVGALALALSAWVGGFAAKEMPAPRPPVDITVAGSPGAALTDEPDEDPTPEAETAAVEPPAPDVREKRDQPAASPEQAESAPDVSQEVKDSSGKTGSGRSSGAMSSSAASESRSAPSTQGQSSKPAPRDPKAKPKEAKKPKPVTEEPEPEERPEDEESGSTAGKGSSKGSNKNPTASDWKSRDQVTDTDDQEIEDDQETDDDEEEQENRGGVQPSLRDRRPPVSRDLQIGFGNRPNPDANGRGGPSEQKKSRGVASLVLGVPIPDRIKGRPGPGPTKITQERIEPQAEQPKATQASTRLARDGSFGELSALDIDPALRDLVRRYFLSRRQQQP